MMEYNTQKYQFNQEGHDFVVSTGLVGNSIRITCQENFSLDGPFYSNEFSLNDLRSINQFFMLPQSPEEALEEINKVIERQKAGLSKGNNDTMLFIGYLIIGTDNDAFTLPLRRDYEPNKYGIFTPPKSNAADLVLQSNYQVDGERLKNCEKNCGDLQRDQTFLEEELNRVIPQINKLRKLSLDIKEENALIKERLKILQVQLEEKKRNVFKLKEENENLRRENQELLNFIKNQENIIREKQALQKNIKIKSRPNINKGKTAVTSKFEQSALRTFLPRAVVKPITEDYIQNNNHNITNPNNFPVQQYVITSNQKELQPRYLPTVITEEKVMPPHTIIIQEEHPDVTYSTKPNVGDDMQFSAQQYITPNTNLTYNNINASPSSNKKNIIFKGKINDKSYSSHYVTAKDFGYTNTNERIQDSPYTSTGIRNIPYSSSGTREQDSPYTSSGAKNIAYSSSGAKNIPYSSSGTRDKGSPYTSSGAKNITYSSSGTRNNPYSSSGTKNIGYSSSGKRNEDVPYTSQMGKGINNKDKGYSSSKINQKDGAYGSQISLNSDIGGYSSQMANNLEDSANAGYSSQMALAKEKIIQGKNNKRPKGSRAPNINQSNYNMIKGSRRPNANNMTNNEPDVGYNSFK